MSRWLAFAAVALLVASVPAAAADLTGYYVEARTCDVWTGACFGNAEMNVSGKHAVMAWKIEKGTVDQVRLDGLGVVAVVNASDTLGLEQTGPAKAILIVDAKADPDQRKALISLAKKQGGAFVRHVVAVQTAPVELTVGDGKDELVARLDAGDARIKTRRIDKVRDRACGTEREFYPALSKDVKVQAAVAVENSYSGKGLREMWNDAERRSAYVGKFVVR